MHLKVSEEFTSIISLSKSPKSSASMQVAFSSHEKRTIANNKKSRPKNLLGVVNFDKIVFFEVTLVIIFKNFCEKTSKEYYKILKDIINKNY